VVSPFGFGEITLKDFEVFLTGGLLLKPDMSHMQTWPDVFRAGETMAAHAWDLSDFEDTVARTAACYDEFRLLPKPGSTLICRTCTGRRRRPSSFVSSRR
jgi:hypothetical protein